jgi:hypothetical protein
MKKIIAALVLTLSVLGGTAATASASTGWPAQPPSINHVVWTSQTSGHGLANYEGVPTFYATFKISTVYVLAPTGDHGNPVTHAVVTIYWPSGKHMTSNYLWANYSHWVLTSRTGTIPTQD